MKETFSRSIRDKEVFFKHAKGERDVFGKEMHTFHEIFMFIGGEADFITESGREPLVPYTVAVIPRGSFHQFTVLGEEGDYHRAVLQFEDAEPWKSFFDAKMRRARVVHSQSLRDVFSRLIALCEQGRDKKEESALLRAFLTEALAYLPSDEKKKAPEGAFHALTYEAIRYIEDHLLSPLLVETVSDALHVSPSYLAHVFKRDMNVPVHKYVLEKKLIAANVKLKNGAKATEVAEALGFGDYSGFYRQYKKMFGVAPSRTVLS